MASSSSPSPAEAVANAEARLLSRLLDAFCAARPAAEHPPPADADAERDGAKAAELALIEDLLALAPAAQESVVRSLLAAPASLVRDFAPVLQFLTRVVVVAHSAGHGDDGDGGDGSPRACTWARNGHVRCFEYEREERGEDDPSAASERIVFRFPADVRACLGACYGSVKRLKCEEVWHGDHMAYRCRTCGLSDSSCMCLACFDPDEHEGHDYRVYRCASGGCCDCGDPLAWKPEGFCKRHRQTRDAAARLVERPLDHSEGRVVQDLVRAAVRLCADVMREVYLFCLRPTGAGHAAAASERPRALPTAGRSRAGFSPAVQAHLGRLEQALAWLQMLAMSCVNYRNIVSRALFEPLPPSFRLEPAALAEEGVAGAAGPAAAAAEEEAVDESEARGQDADQLVALDVFLKAGVLLPVDMCDVLGVLYLKLLFDHDFKQRYTCHFVDWYSFFIDVYLQASAEANEEGMRNLSRFIDRLFCQLFHSTAQLRELEAVFAARHTSARLRRRALASALRPDASCVEWLLVFLLEQLNSLFKGTMRSAIVQWRPGAAETPLAAGDDAPERGSAAAAAPVVQAVHVVDCSHGVFKKRVYARLCSDLRTLLVHPDITAQGILNSFQALGDECVLYSGSLYCQLVQTFELLQQMDLQQRHVLQHVEYESKNWTFAFVADYELKLLLSAFLSGIPSCFSPRVWRVSECGRPGSGVVALGSRVNPLQAETFQPSALACALLRPLQSALSAWAQRNGCPKWEQGPPEDASESGSAALESVARFYERETFSTSAAAGRINTKSYHLPLHHMYASTAYALSCVVRPESVSAWAEMLGVGAGGADRDPARQCRDVAFWYEAVGHPLRVLLFSREIKAGMWVRNGNVMLQQLTHYHSKHWRYYGLHSDVFLCQLAAAVVPEGSLTRVLLRQFPLAIIDALALRLRRGEAEADAHESKADREMTALCEAASRKEERASRQQLELTEEMFRLVQQLVLAPAKMACAAPDGAARLLEREMRHWLALGPFTRSEVVSRTDMKLLDEIKQSSGHEWAELEDEEILSKVLDAVGDFEEPATKRKLSGAGLASGGGGSLLGFGLKMTGTWRLKPELWARVSPLFECFTPSEAQLCEQNIRKYRPRAADRRGSLVLPVLPSATAAEAHGGMALVLAERILNSDGLLSVVLVLLESFKRERTPSSGSASERKEETGSAPKVTDSLLLEVLNALYVGVQLLEPSDRDRCADAKGARGSDPDDADADVESWSVDKMAARYRDAAGLFDKLCVEVPVGQGVRASVLSVLLELQTVEGGVEDVDAMAELIVSKAVSKSRACEAYVASRKPVAGTDERETRVEREGGSAGDESQLDSKRQAMRRRQQLILEKMRSQQMQFLSSSGESSDALASTATPAVDAPDADVDMSGGSEGEEEDEKEDEEDEEEEEEDEWGFPTGRVDVEIYLDHVSSALTAMCEQSSLLASAGGHGKPRRRRSLRRHSLGGHDPSGSLHPPSGEAAGPPAEEEEEEEGAEECGLCRLPCDPRGGEAASFGLVGMILPTKLARRMGEGPSDGSQRPSEHLKPAPALRVRLPGAPESVRLQLADAAVWSCGHAIHHACLEAYLASLWKHKPHGAAAAALELAGGDERLLCERDMEFVCPICRRLSNCLVPSVDVAAARSPRERSLSLAAPSLDALELEGEREESKDERSDADAPDPTAFLPWLDVQMSFRDDCPQAQRRRSRAMSSLLPRAPSPSARALGGRDKEREAAVERAVGAFCHEVVLLGVRAQLRLPLLLQAARDAEEEDAEARVEAELEQIGAEVGAQTPAWHLLLRCLAVQLAIVRREQQLLGGPDAAAVDKGQLRSMRQLAQVAVAAAALSTRCSLAQGPAADDAPADRRFERLVDRLNGVLFGQQVLFEEKDAAAAGSSSLYGDWLDEVVVGSPLLAHPDLLAVYTMRLVWKLCGLRARRRRGPGDALEMAREAFYSARVLVTAKVLQALCLAQVAPATLDECEARDDECEAEARMDDFEEVESLQDAYAWTARLLARTRLDRPSTPERCGRRAWDARAVEAAVARASLPLVQQLLLLMDVLLPLAADGPASSASACVGVSAAAAGPCAVCDGLHPDASSAAAADDDVAALDRGLRRLHLPPLRLFFHRQTFPAGQRALCQLWGAQLESKAAVSRRAQAQRALELELELVATRPRSPLAKTGGHEALDLRAHLQQLAARDVLVRRARLLVELPRVYMDLFVRLSRKPEGVCATCQQLPPHPGLCLLCGAVVCCFSPCCEAPGGGGGGVGECTQHAQTCGAGTGAFLLLRACTVVLLLGNERRCVWGSLYVDRNGEEDPYLRRGKALALDPARLLALETLLVSHAFSQHTAVLANTSRRDGRRY